MWGVHALFFFRFKKPNNGAIVQHKFSGLYFVFRAWVDFDRASYLASIEKICCLLRRRRRWKDGRVAVIVIREIMTVFATSTWATGAQVGTATCATVMGA
jgi:hypothetical protein